MPAIGDLRNRLLALADLKKTPLPVLEFLHFRLPGQGDERYLRDRLKELANPNHVIWRNFPTCEKNIILQNLSFFLLKMPDTFNPFNASMGNLVLAGSYLKNHKNFNAALKCFSNLINTNGIVLPICEENLNLAARLENGSILVGQHKFDQLNGKVKNFYLSDNEPAPLHMPDNIACCASLFAAAKNLIRKASLICFPMGSFYTSVLANTLVRDVGKNIALNSCAKVFIPNSGGDPENDYLDIADQVALLLKNLKKDDLNLHNSDLLNYVLIDKKNGSYPGAVDKKLVLRLAAMDIEPIFCPIVNNRYPRSHLPLPVLKILLKLAD